MFVAILLVRNLVPLLLQEVIILIFHNTKICFYSFHLFYSQKLEMKSLHFLQCPPPSSLETSEALQNKIQNAFQQITEHKLQYALQNFECQHKICFTTADTTFSNFCNIKQGLGSGNWSLTMEAKFNPRAVRMDLWWTKQHWGRFFS
jgi:hypothetical protein